MSLHSPVVLAVAFSCAAVVALASTASPATESAVDQLEAEAQAAEARAAEKRAAVEAAQSQIDGYASAQARTAADVASAAREGIVSRFIDGFKGLFTAGAKGGEALGGLAEMKQREQAAGDAAYRLPELQAEASTAEQEARDAREAANAARQFEIEVREIAERERLAAEAKAAQEKRAAAEAAAREAQRQKELDAQRKADSDRRTRMENDMKRDRDTTEKIRQREKYDTTA